MSKKYNQELKRQIILNHYEEPENKIGDEDNLPTYFSCTIDSASCIDHLTAFVKIEKNKIIDIKFKGVGCVIATSSTDIMANILKNKTVT
jgi:nitrogen fixation NifU-like protein